MKRFWNLFLSPKQDHPWPDEFDQKEDNLISADYWELGQKSHGASDETIYVLYRYSLIYVLYGYSWIYVLYGYSLIYVLYRYSLIYEKVSDQGPVWVRSEEKIPGVFISTHDTDIKLPECSLDPKLSEYV